MITDLNIDKPIQLLQEVRVLHALCDSGVTLHCNMSEYEKLLPLKQFFGCSIVIGCNPNGKNFTNLISINHHEPTTKIGDVVKHLIFPKTLIEFCETKNYERLDEIYFKGIVTGKRKNSIEKLKQVTNKPVIINSSNRGREFPLKTFDEDYFNEMQKYKFVFCPDGDFIWSYRFFESIMCGAIPIVENETKLFEGFYYYNLQSDLKSITWNEEWVVNNKKILNENFTYEH